MAAVKVKQDSEFLELYAKKVMVVVRKFCNIVFRYAKRVADHGIFKFFPPSKMRDDFPDSTTR